MNISYRLFPFPFITGSGDATEAGLNSVIWFSFSIEILHQIFRDLKRKYVNMYHLMHVISAFSALLTCFLEEDTSYPSGKTIMKFCYIIQRK